MRIQNFRAFSDTHIDFSDTTAFIGPNGVGKSNILRSLDWFFNGAQSSLSERDFHDHDTSNPIQVEVTFTNLTSTDRDALGKYAPADAETFTCWRIQDANGADIRSANSKGFSPFGPIKLATAAADKKRLYKELRDSEPDLDLEDAKTAGAITDAMTSWESRNPERLTDVSEQLETNFFGFNSRGKLRGIFDYIFVGADLRAGEESVDAKSSIIGRILEQAVDRNAADTTITKLADELRQNQHKAFEEAFGDQLANVATSLNTEIARYSPGHTVTVEPTELDLKAPRTTFVVEIKKGKIRTNVEGQGHGFQRTLLVAALQVLANTGPAGSDGTICLAIEEPELFQHPLQERAFARVLRELSVSRDSQVQVAYATHSPTFVDPQNFEEIRRVTQSSVTSSAPSVKSTTTDTIRDKVAGIIDPDVFDRQVSQVISDRLPVALFAERVLVVEGTTDAAVILGVGDRIFDTAIEAAGVAIVPATTKSDVVLFSAILTALGIPNYALFDGDAMTGKRMLEKGQKPAAIQKQLAANAKLNRQLIIHFGGSPVDFPETGLHDQFAIFEDTLETFLETEWPEWIDFFQQWEVENSVLRSKHADTYRIVTSRAGGRIPEFFSKLLGKCGVKVEQEEPDNAL
ncbi:predicted ATP-dependent endonuclease, OLD family [Brachybacterium faecium]|nr:predicted ATP-dependent endonuclease, OLD family [Brachybacterium faecium]